VQNGVSSSLSLAQTDTVIGTDEVNAVDDYIVNTLFQPSTSASDTIGESKFPDIQYRVNDSDLLSYLENVHFLRLSLWISFLITRFLFHQHSNFLRELVYKEVLL
jgi:hypothetical protein